MGIDFLDMEFRIKRRLGVWLDRDRVQAVASHRRDITVGEIFELICEQCPDAGVTDVEIDKEDIWLILQEIVAGTLGVEPSDVSKDKWLKRDLGME